LQRVIGDKPRKGKADARAAPAGGNLPGGKEIFYEAG